MREGSVSLDVKELSEGKVAWSRLKKRAREEEIVVVMVGRRKTRWRKEGRKEASRSDSERRVETGGYGQTEVDFERWWECTS